MKNSFDMNRVGVLVFVLGVVLGCIQNAAAFQPADESVWSAPLYDEYTEETFDRFEPFAGTIDFDTIDYPLLNASIFFHTNRQRRAHGREPLPWSLQLETAAYHHSRIMAELGFVSHSSRAAGRRSTSDRARLAGITNPRIAENVAQNFGIQYRAGSRMRYGERGVFFYPGEDTPIPNHTYLSLGAALVQQWMDSTGHRRNILSTDAVAMGSGADFRADSSSNDLPKVYATQNFQWYEEIVPGVAEDSPPPGWSQ